MRHTYTAKTLAELQSVAHDILTTMPRLLALVGPLGAGKTAFTQMVGLELRIPQQVTSPTYVLQQVYRVAAHPAYDTLVHIDCYRMKTDHEVPALDVPYWCERPKTLVIVEWADRIKPHLAGLQPVWVTFAVHGGVRRLKVS